MSSIAVVGGAGYVGLAYSVLLADLGHHVVSIDTDPVRIGQLCQGIVPNHEPGLHALLHRTLASGRLRFSHEYASTIPDADFVFICVGTPSTASGAADTSAVTEAAQLIAQHAHGHTIVVNKSTMPVGSATYVADILAEHASPPATFDVVSNPEFLREGSAMNDIYHPDRIVLGSDDMDAAAAVGELYQSLGAPVLVTQARTAEMIKYASNAFLANKISFINEVATICEHLGADVSVVVHGMGLDSRISPHFLRPGIGFGGSCFPKDVRALAKMARDNGCDPALLTSVLSINDKMRARVIARIDAHLGGLAGKTLGILGLAFKPDTDDIREAPAIALIQALLAAGATVRATDPVAGRRAAAAVPEIQIARDAYGAATGADAVVLVTEWAEYRSLNMDRLANAMRGTLVVDGRNALDPATVTAAGLTYAGIGRSATPAVTTIQMPPVVITAQEPGGVHQMAD
ncbi:MAG TPA: UDP-glucose/GDP-mannose dehydrogenase family protein [Thermomicrobiales bacterium]|nr:UDP-glucose/GDP-mannose dehydrogenase family protein [Thermomicrobiales bacterium]